MGEITLDDLRENVDDVIMRKIKRGKLFSKTIIWLCLVFERTSLIYPSEHAQFFNLAPSQSFTLFRELENLQLIVKGSGGAYHPVKNDGHLVVSKYLEASSKSWK